MRILLIRHAEPDYINDSITEKGKREARLLSDRIARYNIRDFYVSPLGRARDTAEYTLQKTGRKAEVLSWLQEFRGKYPDPETGKPLMPGEEYKLDPEAFGSEAPEMSEEEILEEMRKLDGF